MEENIVRVAAIGGGRGPKRVIQGIMATPGVRIRITGISPSADAGGDTGEKRKIFGYGGWIGDTGRWFANLSKKPKLAEAFNYKFEREHLRETSIKNNTLLGFLEYAKGDVHQALMLMRDAMHAAPHWVVPSSIGITHILGDLHDGSRTRTEYDLDMLARNDLYNPHRHRVTNVHLDPPVDPYPGAVNAIVRAHQIVLCPSSVFTSIGAALLALGREPFKKTRATISIFLNLVIQGGEDEGRHGGEIVEQYEEWMGRHCHHIICDDDSQLPDDLLSRYKDERKVPLSVRLDRDSRVIRAPLAMCDEKGHLRHNPQVVTRIFTEILGVSARARTHIPASVRALKAGAHLL